MHWTGAYLARPWPDCAALVEAVLRERLGRTIRLPAPPGSPRTHARAIAAGAGDLARPLAAGEAPAEIDGVLMRTAGHRLAGHHIGIYAEIAGEAHVLHAVEELGACLHPLTELPQRGYECLGIWRWL